MPATTFVDEPKLILVERICAAAEPERIEHGVARGVAVLDFGNRPLPQRFRIDRHRGHFLYG